MKWTKFDQKKPSKSGFYHWQGKTNTGGFNYFDIEEGEFDFPDYIPVNKVSDHYLEWLDEGEVEG